MLKLSEKTYLNLMMILLPLINFVSGIAIDLYAPSMPALVRYFHSSATAIQNTVTVAVLGWAIGALIWGVFFDVWGRKKIILSMLAIFVVTSLLAIYCSNVYQLILIRFIQGLCVAAMSVGSRVLIADHFSGHKFSIAVIYSSVAYALGTIIGPFIGGYLQYHWGWQANFIAFIGIGSIVLLMVLIYVQEQFKHNHTITLKEAALFYKRVLTHPTFIAGCIITGIIQTEMMFYPTFGPFLVENHLHYTAVIYGNCAMIISMAYLGSSLINRILLKHLSPQQLLKFGYLGLFTALILQLVFAFFFKLNLWTLLLPIMLIYAANGFIFGNVMPNCLKLFPHNAGVATATQVCLLMIIGASGIFIISLFKIFTLSQIFWIFAILILIKVYAYKKAFYKAFNLT